MKHFFKPEPAQKPVYAWAWNGKLSKESIKRQLQDMKARDIQSFYILPEPPTFRPDSTYSEMNVAYMGKEFMDFVCYAAECAKELDMTMWLYDEPGWPSGNAGHLVVDREPALASKWVSRREYQLKAGAIYEPKVDVIASFCDERIEKGFCCQEDTTVLEFFWDSRRQFTRADLLEPNTTKQFLDCTYEVYKENVGKYFGSLIPCIFTDEPCVMGTPWPYDFAERFEEKYGYDIRDYMNVLLGDEIDSAKKEEVSIHYHELISELFAERYFNTIRNWCHENNIKFVGHIDREHEIRDLRRCKYGYLLNIFRKFDIPGIDVIAHQVYPDSNPCKEGYNFFPRLASSAAAQNGTKDALTESLGVAGTMSLDTIRYIVNYQVIRGINIINFMGLSNAENGVLGSQFRPNHDKKQLFSKYYPLLHDYIARITYLVTLGESEADTALYIPVRDIMAGGKCEETAAVSFESCGYALERMGVDFDLIDDTVIEEAKKYDNMLQIGLAKYKNIIVPECRYMPANIRGKIKDINSVVDRTLIPKAESLRTKTRVLSDGSKVILIFNESIHEMSENINFPRMNYLYEMDLTTGEIIFCEYNNKVSFYGGEMKAFLVSDTRMEAKEPYETVSTKVISEFLASPISTFTIEKTGTCNKHIETSYGEIALGSWESVYGKAFSGEVSYITDIVIDETEAAAYCIDLGRVDSVASIFLNGKEYGRLAMTPKKLIIPKNEMPKGQVNLEIRVANTAANQYAFADYEQYYTSMELGPYHAMMKEFEKEEAGGGLYGPVTISVLK